MSRRLRYVLLPMFAASVPCAAIGQTTVSSTGAHTAAKLKHVESIERDELLGVVRANPSPDGKFLYAAAWQAASIVTFARDPKTGRLQYRQSYTDERNLRGVTEALVTGDGRFVVATSFESKTITLLRRDQSTGRLTPVNLVRDEGEPRLKMKYPIAGAVTADSQFVYVADHAGRSVEGFEGALQIFRINEVGRLKWVTTDVGNDACYKGARDIAIHPNGKFLFVPCAEADNLVAVERDPRTGKTKVRHVAHDESDGVHGLAGAFGAAVSPDGHFVYTVSGRFRGDNAISVFSIDAKGALKLVQEVENGGDTLKGFEGGNSIRVSPDGNSVYATATVSGTLASFERDAKTGKLTLVELLADGKPATLAGAAGVGISPDGRFIYVAAEEKMGISVFERP